MEFTEEFKAAFDHAMIYEVGAFWNPNDPEVIKGLCQTREQRRKVGYVNIAADRGGETKYGIAKKANPSVNISLLNLNGAMQTYFNEYWLRGKNDKLPYPISLIHFDGCVNHGVGRAAKFLQRAANVNDDGIIGNGTLAAIKAADPKSLIKSISEQRINFYNGIVARDASQKTFLKGWMRRIDEITDFTLKAL